MAAVKTNDLTKQFGNVVAVDGLNITVEKGEVFGFLGPNGAGKSTTINMLLDFTRPTSGTISILGLDPQTESRAVRERIGILPEGYSLYDRLSARQHISFAIEMKDSQENPDTVLKRVGLTEYAKRSVGKFSKGMCQRLALGMALVDQPDLLILDEPSSGLDPTAARELQKTIIEEANRGATVFFSSHIMHEVESVCDRVGIMNEGKLVTVDTVEGLRDSMQTDYSIHLTVNKIPDTLKLAEFEGVKDVTVENSTIRVKCSESSEKARIITHIESTGASIEDIEINETNLDDLFAKYTSNESTKEVI